VKKCPICREIIPYKDLKNAIVFTPGKLINGIFCGEESYYYHKKCVQDEEILLYR